MAMMDYLERAREIYTAPPAGASYSLPLAGSEQPGRSPIYRHWRFQKQLLDTLDPHVPPPMLSGRIRSCLTRHSGSDRLRALRSSW